ncbi:ABC transporter permease [Natroniella sp. ANB-PHB2]|uniref:ABC transporter permease n=1 Tax=Natroniella sp. ANB-PHB2 TaxID=3384444 RepID=UPI0038D45ECF
MNQSFLKHKQNILRGISIICLFIIWWLLAEFGLQSDLLGFDTTRWPTAWQVIQAGHSLLTQQLSTMLRHIGNSLYRVLVGFLLAAILGVPLGLGIGWNQIIRNLTFPIIEILRPIPPLAWIPVILIAFGTNTTMIFITFIGAFFPIVLNSILGVQSVEEVEVRAAESLGADEIRLFKEVVIPKALPSVFTGLSVGMGIAWISIVAAEMIAGDYGLGYFVWSMYNTLNYSHVVIGMILLGLLGYLCSTLIRYLGAKLTPWTKFQGGDK